MGVPAVQRAEATAERGRREAKRAATRDEILRAGRALFASEGLYESRIEDITQRAGIAKGTLYLYFDDKEALVAAVVAEGFRELQRTVEARLGGARTLRAEAERVARAHIDYFAAHPDLLRILHQVRGVLMFQRGRWRRLARGLDEHLRQVEGWLAHAQPEHRRELAVLLFGGVSGATSVLVSIEPSAALGRRSATWARAIAAGVVAAPQARSGAGGGRRGR